MNWIPGDGVPWPAVESRGPGAASRYCSGSRPRTRGPEREGDPVTYEYTFGIDLRVNCQDSLQYIATAPSLFVLQIGDEVSATEETPWEIILWFDIDDDGSCGRPVIPTSWGELKALFLDIDRD